MQSEQLGSDVTVYVIIVHGVGLVACQEQWLESPGDLLRLTSDAWGRLALPIAFQEELRRRLLGRAEDVVMTRKHAHGVSDP